MPFIQFGHISFLRENGYIERVGSKKAGYWNGALTYCLIAADKYFPSYQMLQLSVYRDVELSEQQIECGQVKVVLQLAAMSACGFFFEPATAAFICYLLFLFFGGIIAAIVLSSYDNKRSKLSALCVFIGLIGVAVMQLCTFFIQAPFSGIVGFIVFLVFAAIIALIIIMNKKEFIHEGAYSLHDNVKREAARHLARVLKSRGVPDAEIRSTIMETFRLRQEIVDEIMQ